MLKPEKEKIVAELTERLRSSETLMVADYRGLSVKEVDELRTKLLEQGASFTVVKNSLTRRAAEAAGAEALLALLDGPSAIAFLEAGSDPVAVAKALAASARTTRVLAVRGGVMQGRTISAADVEELAKLPPVDVLRGQVLAAVTSPIYTIVGLFTAPLRDLHGLIQARIDQLGGEPETAQEEAAEPEAPEPEAPEPEAPEPEAPEPEPEVAAEASAPEAPASEEEPVAEAETEVSEPAEETAAADAAEDKEE
jgi:large subunit ribosomal protein L10